MWGEEPDDNHFVAIQTGDGVTSKENRKDRFAMAFVFPGVLRLQRAGTARHSCLIGHQVNESLLASPSVICLPRLERDGGVHHSPRLRRSGRDVVSLRLTVYF